MAPIRYSLHYEDYSEHLMARFGKLLQMQSLVDMTLMCASHTLRVHKTVLAASSAYFQEVLQKQTGEPLIILKMRFTVLKCLIEFMYCGKTQCLEENLDELVSAAQFLKIKGLSKVTKEGLGITNNSDLPVFSPPIVINKPPQSLLDLQNQLQLQENIEQKPPPPPPQPLPQPPQLAQATSTSQSVDGLGRPNKALQRISWEPPPQSPVPGSGTVPMGRVTERALYKREQDSRKAIHQLKHMQSRHQDYMERVSLSQAVSSICGPESSSAHNYMNIDNDLMYMDQTVSSNVLDPTTYSKENDMSSETITSSYPTNSENTGISNAMSQYVNALKSAGLPTDLPILFESGDGSYINVNEQVLLDMVQSSEIQYEVIEQPNIIEKVADPSEIKSIDDLSKSIERGEMLMGSKGYNNSYDKNANQYNRHDDAMNSLNAILPDNLEPFAEQQNFVVLDPRLQEGSNIDQANDFSCIDGDMQFFTKSMSDDVKKYYEEQQLNDARVMEQLCPTSTTLDTNFNISLLDSKSNISQQYPEDLRRNEDCYDFGLQLPQTSDFKEDALDCLMATTPKQTEDSQHRAQERDEIIQDLMNIEKNMNQNVDEKPNFDSNVQDFNTINDDAVFNEDADSQRDLKKDDELTTGISSSGLHWDNMDIGNKEDEHCDTEMAEAGGSQAITDGYQDPVIDLTAPTQSNSENTSTLDPPDSNKENEPENANVESSDNDIPFAVGLLPLKQVQPTEDDSLLKRQHSIDDLLDNIDAKCLKRKVKYKK